MAEAPTETQRLFERLRREAECPMCSKTVDQPKFLPCLHSFCLGCLNRFSTTEKEQGKTVIECCVCSSSVKIPDGGTFDNFPTPFHLSRLVDILMLENFKPQQRICDICEVNSGVERYCLECKMFYCVDCLGPHSRFIITRGHYTISLHDLEARSLEEAIRRPVLCAQRSHEGEEVKYYCQDCQVSICQKCIVDPHYRHNIVEILQATDEGKQQIMEGVEKLKTRLSECEKEAKKEAESFHRVHQNYLAAKNAIHKNVAELILQLKQHEQDVLAKLDNAGNEQRSAFEMQLERHQTHMALLSDLVKYGECAIQGTVNPVVLETQSTVIGELQQVLSAGGNPRFNLPPVQYVANEGFEEILRNSSLGEIVVRVTDPSNSLARGNGLTKVRGGKEATFTIITRDSRNRECHCEDDLVEVIIFSPTGEELEKKVEDEGDGKYTVSYMPQRRGQHKVIVKVNGTPLNSSPWTVHVIASKQTK